MGKALTNEGRLRGALKQYCQRIAYNKPEINGEIGNNCLTEEEILRAFDLAVQKGKLTTLEAELVKPKPAQMSKIDISGIIQRLEDTYKFLGNNSDWLRLKNNLTVCNAFPVKESKIDVSGIGGLEIGTAIHTAVEALTKIASYDEGDTVGAAFDEPSSAKVARNALKIIFKN